MSKQGLHYCKLQFDITGVFMYSTIEDFTTDWKAESTHTRSLLDALNDESLSQKVWDGGRTLGYLAWHIVVTVGEMGSKTGLEYEAPAEDSTAPASASEIADEYKKVSENLINAINSQWSDDSLEEIVSMYGQEWKNKRTLSALVRHEIHHRAQLTVLMRQAGLIVPGIYGPSKEEWKKFGMQEMP
jgi:uncharacterized damage-inducible protein DinB